MQKINTVLPLKSCSFWPSMQRRRNVGMAGGPEKS